MSVRKIYQSVRGAGQDLRIHDLRHFATTMLFIEGVANTIIRKMTGHLWGTRQVQTLSEKFKQQIVEPIADQLSRQLGTKIGTAFIKHCTHSANTKNGGADGIRTRDLRRDRPAF